MGGFNFHSPYSRSGQSTQGTVVPGMMGMDNAANAGVNSSFSQVAETKRQDPVVGFVYTISHKGLTEYWPIYLGKNTIGRSQDNDIVLAEGTVSGQHAAINVKKLKTASGLYAIVRDEGSKTGIFVNDEEVLSELQLSNNDVITIGDSYRLLIFLIDTAAYGLVPAENFQEVDEAPANERRGNVDPYNPSGRATGGTETVGPGGNSGSGATEFL